MYISLAISRLLSPRPRNCRTEISRGARPTSVAADPETTSGSWAPPITCRARRRTTPGDSGRLSSIAVLIAVRGASGWASLTRYPEAPARKAGTT